MKDKAKVEVSTLSEMLREKSSLYPEKNAYIFLKDGDEVGEKITFRQVDQEAQRLAGVLQSEHLQGERVLLLYPSSLEYIKAFFGCIYASSIAVPVYPPRANKAAKRIVSIVQDSQAKAVLTTKAIRDKLLESENFGAIASKLQWIATDALSEYKSHEWSPSVVDPNDIAYLQYTSGSTGHPKGVEITHRNVLHNSRYIHTLHRTGPDTVSVSWLPIYHDMGLIDGILQSAYTGGTAVLMPAVSFLQRPIRWLKAISDYSASHSGGPNFAYDLCIEKIRKSEIESLDLSCWTNAYVGAEIVWAKTLFQFSQKFKEAGFEDRSFHPCYGLAESTLVATGGEYGERPTLLEISQRMPGRKCKKDGIESIESGFLVGNGKSHQDIIVKIVNPVTLAECLPNEEGEIWIHGPSVARGYWKNEDLTKKTFQARCMGSDTREYLRTGDLGFLHKDELFYTGRLKELIIIRGQNYYPYDFERLIQDENPAFVTNGGAAFSVYVSNVEKIIIVQEVARTYIRKIDMKDEINKARKIIWNEFQLQLYDVVLTKPNILPRTSSGKVQRGAAKNLYSKGQIEYLASHIIEKS